MNTGQMGKDKNGTGVKGDAAKVNSEREEQLEEEVTKGQKDLFDKP